MQLIELNTIAKQKDSDDILKITMLLDLENIIIHHVITPIDDAISNVFISYIDDRLNCYYLEASYEDVTRAIVEQKRNHIIYVNKS